MTDYTVPFGTFSLTKTLTASAADVVTFTDARASYLTVTNVSGTDPLYVRADGETAVAEAEGAYVVLPGEARLVANALPTWYQSSDVIPEGEIEFGGGNIASSPSSPGSVRPMESMAGKMTNPGTTVSVAGTSGDASMVALAG